MQIRVIFNVYFHVDLFKSVFKDLNHIVTALLHALNTRFVVLTVTLADNIENILLLQITLPPTLGTVFWLV